MANATCPHPHCLLQHRHADSELVADLALVALSGEDTSALVGEEFVPIEAAGACEVCLRIVTHGGRPLPTTAGRDPDKDVSHWHWRRDHRRKGHKYPI